LRDINLNQLSKKNDHNETHHLHDPFLLYLRYTADAVPVACAMNSSGLMRAKVSKADYLWRHQPCVMNIQLIIITLVFAVALFLTGRKLYRSVSGKKEQGCANCGKSGS
jgi:hypothetical protein